MDADQANFPAEVLFEWRRRHEESVASKLGKTSELIRIEIADEEIGASRNVSRLARRIIIDKPSAWEYKLTAEVLRFGFAPISARVRALKRGLYVRPVTRLLPHGSVDWFQDRLFEIGKIIPAITENLNSELAEGWGPLGTPGDVSRILQSCDLLISACRQLVDWEENFHFTAFPAEFEALGEIFRGIGARALEQVFVIPDALIKVVNRKSTGVHDISIVIDLPEGWADACAVEFERAIRSLAERNLI